MKKAEDGRLVYSTENDDKCRVCGKPARKCSCKPERNRPAGDGIVRISRQTRGRKGSGVSIITGLPLQDSELTALAAQLKKKCGCGGTVKNGVIEIQGDKRETLAAHLSQHGYNVKLAGG